MVLELVPVLRGTFGYDIPQGNTGQLRHSIPEQSHSRLGCASQTSLWLWTVKCTVQDRMPNEPWIKHNGMDPRPLASTGIGPNLGQRGWNHEPHYGVEVHGPSGPGDPCAVRILFFIWFISLYYIHNFKLQKFAI